MRAVFSVVVSIKGERRGRVAGLDFVLSIARIRDGETHELAIGTE